MDPFRVIFLLLLVSSPILLLAYSTELIRRRSIKNRNSKFISLVRYKIIFGVLLITGSGLLMVNLWFSEPVFDTPEKKIEYAKKRNLPNLLADGYRELIEKDSLNLDYHYSFVVSHFQQKELWHNRKGETILRDDLKVFSYYNRIISLARYRKDAAIGHFGYGLGKMWTSKIAAAIENLIQIEPKDLKYRSFSIATCFRLIKKYDIAEKFYKKEIADSGYVEGAYKSLVDMYMGNSDFDKAIPFIYNPQATKYIPKNKIKVLAYLDNNIKLYFISLFELIYDRINIVGLIAAFLITLTYLIFLRAIDIYKREKWINVYFVFLLGVVMSFGSDYLSTYIQFNLHYEPSGEKLHDFGYAVFATGAVEEIIKIIPLIILLTFTKIAKEPYDYIVYASVSALGFAFMENLLYFNTDSINIIHGRALISVIGHMFYSSVIAYGLILAKYRRNMHPVFAFICFYALASVSHGLYNWLLQFGYSYLFVLYYLVILKIWVAFINNSLNNSTFFDYNIKIPARKIQYFLVMSLCGILAFEYISLGYIYGPETANNSFLNTSSTGSIIIFFLSTRLSRFDLVKKHWKIIDFRINPFLFTAPLNYVGTEIRFVTYSRKILNEGLSDIFYKGKIVNRINIENDAIWSFKKRKNESNWFVVDLDIPFKYNNFLYKSVFIKFRGGNPGLLNGNEALAKLLVTESPKTDLSDNMKRTSMQFVDTIVVDCFSETSKQ